MALLLRRQNFQFKANKHHIFTKVGYTLYLVKIKRCTQEIDTLLHTTTKTFEAIVSEYWYTAVRCICY